jgi:two-component system chemotaxis response regulator CheY
MFKILIIDDTKSVHAFVGALLSKSKEVKFTGVFDGAQALELLKKNSDFDLILLDWEMPVLNGPNTFKEIKKMNLKAPTVMMTTKNAPEDIAMMLEMGVAEYLMKPFTIDILFEKIEAVSGRALPYAS